MSADRLSLFLPLVAALSLAPGCFSSTSSSSSTENEEAEDSSDPETEGSDTSDSSNDGMDSSAEDTGMESNDGDMETTGETAEDTGDTGDALCDEVDGQVCLSIPDDWEGPLVLADEAEECGDLYATDLGALFDGLDPGDASCDCSCGAATVNCSETMNYIGYSGTNCVNGQGQFQISENECENTFSASHAVSLGAATTSCGAGTVAEEIPEPTWDEGVRLCAADELGDMCDDGGCFPEAPSAVCISREGDHESPAGFDDKTNLYSGFDDSRSCPNSCSCSGSGGTCSVSVTGYAGSNCSSPSGAKTVDSGSNTCVATNSQAVKSIRPGNVTVKNGGTCSPGEASLSGTVVEDGITTVCCAG